MSIQRKKIIIVDDDKRITSNIIQLFEAVEAIGIRASNIENGSPYFIDAEGITDPLHIAIKEYRLRASPLILQRVIVETEDTIIVEHFKVREMTFPIENLINLDYL